MERRGKLKGDEGYRSEGKERNGEGGRGEGRK